MNDFDDIFGNPPPAAQPPAGHNAFDDIFGQPAPAAVPLSSPDPFDFLGGTDAPAPDAPAATDPFDLLAASVSLSADSTQFAPGPPSPSSAFGNFDDVFAVPPLPPVENLFSHPPPPSSQEAVAAEQPLAAAGLALAEPPLARPVTPDTSAVDPISFSSPSASSSSSSLSLSSASASATAAAVLGPMSSEISLPTMPATPSSRPLDPVSLERSPGGGDVEASCVYAMPLSPGRGESSPLINVKVGAARKMGEGLSSFMAYPISGKTRLRQFPSKEFSCLRRYREFHWLQAQLREAHRGVIIPPIPEKAVTGTTTPQYVEYRRKELERFLIRIVSHDLLALSPYVQSFLSATDQQLSAIIADSANQKTQAAEKAKREADEKAEQEKQAIAVGEAQAAAAEKKKAGWGAWISTQASRVASSITSVTSSVGHAAAAIGGPEEIDPWIAEKTSWILRLDTALAYVAKMSAQHSQQQRAVAEAYNDVGLKMTILAEVEGAHDKIVSDCLTRIASNNGQATDSRLLVAAEQASLLEDVMNDYLRYLQSVNIALAQRVEVLAAWQLATRTVGSKKEQRATTHNEVHAAWLDRTIPDAERAEEEQHAEYERINGVVRSELARFERTMAMDITVAISALVQLYLNQSLAGLDAWKKLQRTDWLD